MISKIMRAIRPTAPEFHPADLGAESYLRSGLRFACRGEQFQAANSGLFAEIARREKERNAGGGKAEWLANAKRQSAALAARLKAAEGRQ